MTYDLRGNVVQGPRPVKAQAHQECNATLVSTSFVVQETVSLLQARHGVQAVRSFHSRLLPLLDIVWIDAALYGRAMAAGPSWRDPRRGTCRQVRVGGAGSEPPAMARAICRPPTGLIWPAPCVS